MSAGGARTIAATSDTDLNAIRWDAQGLVPVIVQDVVEGRVLMVAYADREALDATIATGHMHFHSRSRDALWRKGETSGNVLQLVNLAIDCDADAVLATVEPTGPTCHRGTSSCFDLEGAVERAAPGENAGPGKRAGRSAPPSQGADEARREQGFVWLENLSATIAERARTRPAGSYTTSLLEGGVDAAARKVVEEAVEVVLAAKDDAAAEGSGFDRSATRSALAGEAADLIYHLLVVMAERNVAPGEVIDVLRERHRA